MDILIVITNARRLLEG